MILIDFIRTFLSMLILFKNYYILYYPLFFDHPRLMVLRWTLRIRKNIPGPSLWNFAGCEIPEASRPSAASRSRIPLVLNRGEKCRWLGKSDPDSLPVWNEGATAASDVPVELVTRARENCTPLTRRRKVIVGMYPFAKRGKIVSFQIYIYR